MKLPINPRVTSLQSSEIRKFSEMAEKYPNAITFAIGQPDFATPEHVKEAGRAAINSDRTVYTTNAGLLELREAAAGFVDEKYGLHYDPRTEVIVTAGASQALDIALRTILEEGSEVIIPAPSYPGYEPLVRLCGGVPEFMDIASTGFRVDPDALAATITEKTRAVVVPSANPTGVTLSPENLAEIAEVVRGREIYLISDEIYAEISYGRTHLSIATLPGMRDQTIVINGLSKSHAMTGWRIGLTFAPAALTAEMIKVHQYSATCASSISQVAAVEALTVGRNDADVMREEYEVRRDYGINRLAGMGMGLPEPSGAFYLFPSIREFGLSSFDFAVGLLESQQVAVVPGTAFNPYGEGFIRISYACSMDTLREGLDRMQRYVDSLSL